MYYKIEKGSYLFDKVKSFWSDIDKVRAPATKQMKDLISYAPKDSHGYNINTIYTLSRCIDDILFIVKIPDGVPYEPIEGMQEILFSEYSKLEIRD